MKKISLNGKWTAQGGNFSDIKTQVPGCIHTDLLANGLIDDPYYRDNESKYMFIGETDWIYEKNFDVSDEFLNHQQIELVCNGLDTFSAIYINGNKIASTDNMFRKWQWDIKDCLVKGKNTIRIDLLSTFPYIKKKMNERYLNLTGIDDHRIIGGNYVRKMQCNYGWDWGPMCVTAGIWKDIQIVGYEDIRIDHVQVKQQHSTNEVTLDINTTFKHFEECSLEALKKKKLHIEISHENELLQSFELPIEDKMVSQKATLIEPKLWWPNNLGDQSLYDVKVALYKEDALVDEKTERIGIRTLVLDRHTDEHGESFQFVVNGVAFFAKGANWIPIDTFVTRGSDEFYRQLLTDAKEANMNFIRVWGGGIYESDTFYQICDELGLCVWQDFMFACSAYPAYDNAYLATVKEEVKDNILRIRNHPSLALWCGNNEIEYVGGMVSHDGSPGTMTYDEYRLLFHDVIPSLIKEYDGEHDYWASSPMDTPSLEGQGGSDPSRGDAHLWDVWHGLKPFEWYRTCDHRFNSEFGFQSFLEPEAVKSYTEEGDRNVTSYVMEKHQRSGIGNSVILHYMLSWFKMPMSFDMMMWTSQILQSLAIKYAVENWRRKMPRGMGTLYWQLNDCWPVASWSSIDWMGNWKALHYRAKKFFAPILLSGIENKEACELEIYLSNDTLQDISGKINWRVFTFDGEIVKSGTIDGAVKKNSSALQAIVSLKDIIPDEKGARECVVAYSFKTDEEIISENTTFFRYPKHLMIKKPNIHTTVQQVDAAQFIVNLETDKPSLWVWTDLGSTGVRYSDRFFDLFPDRTKQVIITLNEAMTLDEFTKELKVYTILDTYQ